MRHARSLVRSLLLLALGCGSAGAGGTSSGDAEASALRRGLSPRLRERQRLRQLVVVSGHRIAWAGSKHIVPTCGGAVGTSGVAPGNLTKTPVTSITVAPTTAEIVLL